MKKLLVLALLIGGFSLGFKHIPVNYNISVTNLHHGMGYKLQFETLWRNFVLDLADSNDTVTIHINSPGGYVTHLIEIVNKMEASEAHIISINHGFALSAAGVIAFVADEIRADAYSVYLFHRPGYFVGGVRVLAPLDSPSGILTNQIMEKHIFPHLTLDEKMRYIKGEDVTIVSSVILSRGK